MNLLFLSPVGTIGGAERVLLAAIRGIQQVNPTACIRLLTLADGPLVPAAEVAGATVVVVPLPAALARIGDSELRGRSRVVRLATVVGWAVRAGPAIWAFRRRLRNAIASFAPDIVLSNGIKTHVLARFAVPTGIPVVWYVHDFYGLRPAAARVLRRLSGRTRLAIAVSRAVAADARRVLPHVPVEVVLNAVDIHAFAPDGPTDDLDALAGLPTATAGTVRIGLVATYARWKGHLAFLDAAAKLFADPPAVPVRFYIVGGPIYHTAAQVTRDELEREAADRGLTGRVGFVPFRQDAAPVYRALDVVVHASTLPEPFGLTVVEGMAAGRAVVVSAAGGAAELFTDGHDALSVAPGDPAQLVTAIRRLVERPDLRAGLGTNARASALKHFDQQNYGSRLAEALRHVFGGADVPPLSRVRLEEEFRAGHGGFGGRDSP